MADPPLLRPSPSSFKLLRQAQENPPLPRPTAADLPVSWPPLPHKARRQRDRCHCPKPTPFTPSKRRRKSPEAHHLHPSKRQCMKQGHRGHGAADDRSTHEGAASDGSTHVGRSVVVAGLSLHHRWPLPPSCPLQLSTPLPPPIVTVAVALDVARWSRGCALRSSVNVGGDRRDTAIHPWGRVTGSHDAFGIKQAVGKVGTKVPTTVWDELGVTAMATGLKLSSGPLP
uniref:Uncharacterized protein n=1 Tax=Oryza sativa subsp. japonica TaxID=39947 RepID=Q5Z7H7_ORYSJ|nr:hypothetical protein [Oryza sativa Japonica Group]BAD54137.1 hypothetical protein [Oryza sativa Japonica Group]